VIEWDVVVVEWVSKGLELIPSLVVVAFAVVGVITVVVEVVVVVVVAVGVVVVVVSSALKIKF
jgi:hypothetical protein